MSIVSFSRLIGPVLVDCVLNEQHSSDIEITNNPVETGAEINDHAYIKPKELQLEIADGAAAGTFESLVRFQESREPFTIVTGLSVYRDMLINSISATRDKDNSLILHATLNCKQVVIVSTASAPNDNREIEPGKPGGKKSINAARPSAESATSPDVADRTATTVQTGDNPTETVEPRKSKSLLSEVFG